MTANQIAYQRNLEAKRSNQAQEAENKRHNVRSEDLGLKTLIESQRHNIASETEANRSALAKEMENIRSNKAKEALTEAYQNAQISQGWTNLAEQKRANQAREADVDSSREQSQRQFSAAQDQAWNIASLDRDLKDKLSTRSGFVDLLSTGVNAVSGVAKSILSALK